MFTQNDLTRLITLEPTTAVSIFMNTHARGKEVRQDPIRLKNLLAEARTKLVERGLPEADATAVLSPATDLLENREFWQNQSAGLALFIDEHGMREYVVPLGFDELVVVGEKFHVRPLLPLLAADGHFSILTVTADKATYFSASRHELTEERYADLPERPSIENDYENPVQASPPARPAVGTANIPNAQVYGESPPDFRKARLLEYVAEVAKATEKILAASPQPLVLVADAEIGGHFQQAGQAGQLLAGVVETNPSALNDAALHDVAYAQVKEQLDKDRVEALARAAELLGRGDESAATEIGDVVRAAHHGRISTLLLHDGEPVWGNYDTDADRVETGRAFEHSGKDLLGIAAIETLQHGGVVHVVTQDEMPEGAEAVAILRY
ncbi:baeRF3 domain-containing protein [Arthrobacter sp. TMS2-4]